MLGIVCHLITFVHIYNKFTIEVFGDARRDHREAVFGDTRRDYREDSVAEITEKKFRLPNLATSSSTSPTWSSSTSPTWSSLFINLDLTEKKFRLPNLGRQVQTSKPGDDLAMCFAQCVVELYFTVWPWFKAFLTWSHFLSTNFFHVDICAVPCKYRGKRSQIFKFWYFEYLE